MVRCSTGSILWYISFRQRKLLDYFVDVLREWNFHKILFQSYGHLGIKIAGLSCHCSLLEIWDDPLFLALLCVTLWSTELALTQKPSFAWNSWGRASEEKEEKTRVSSLEMKRIFTRLFFFFWSVMFLLLSFLNMPFSFWFIRHSIYKATEDTECYWLVQVRRSDWSVAVLHGQNRLYMMITTVNIQTRVYDYYMISNCSLTSLVLSFFLLHVFRIQCEASRKAFCCFTWALALFLPFFAFAVY